MSDLDEMKLAHLIDACGGVDGRVKMQKIVYLLAAMGYDLPYDDFRIRQLGPFSRAVACDTDILKGAGVVEEAPVDHGLDEYGQTVRQYSYTVREPFVRLIRECFQIAAPKGKPGVAEVAQKLRKYDRAVLEVAATRVYLRREDRLENEALEAELTRLKGHLASRFSDADMLLADVQEQGWLTE